MAANMFSRRALQATTRRLAGTNTSIFTKTPLSRLPAPAAVATGQHLQYRPAASTAHVSQSEAEQILAAQRRHRPVSPHLAIYRPQVTWYLSALNRITGATLAGTLYVFGAAYLVSPLFGWHLESATLAATFASLPILVKVALKAFYAFPFAFHGFNGIRHLVWDTGATLTNRQVIITGWTVVGLSTLTALGLTFF
ncbi:cytochrome b subunit of succinate dehydrogenase, Sdh3p [Exophiala dermatitidis]|uniref:Succinate dehydrogenase (Ubiquinone) cytochrome B subunit n=2 Tax=Exophiala dermatitidis TaxID=5970 RepID=H6BW56_EXODN|nr:succinate dehydrogenase (ubiquinone) cytochrome B subunit [Exophiala dermatitidis NIH/UT8656]KAJ4503822.1 cytochrome b subunit of succinate dehydrogenase, Sdh3p [Exophiala dermatitidis]EHY55156.1 succinate dehydrogenase (ubiquinone) cytochrome B subunit [Exophiala dermatitidis NIH/UT8656]KAJ4508137.1 cytochrome b subunit of succinate dehydrogenase, Sdh3p [Exophiala dermatitidis]KAJ4531939.1 cytochrome b subunit of succinate dehydrogenase, Sdh3p [Exophiala dermatitidis]KAJ4540048.1 cytochrom